MAGNKALEKFKNSKVPKRGTTTTTAEVPIYQEPNTHSKIIGTIKKNEIINWISKSICDEREWIRCDNKNNFGYIISGEMDGTCNINMDFIKEKKEEKYSKNESILSQEENEYGQNALNEILEEDEKKVENNNDDDYSNSTSFGNNSNNFDIFDKNDEECNKIFESQNEIVFEPKEENILNEENLHNLYFEGDISYLDKLKKENNKLSKDILNMMEKDQEKKINVSQAIDSISDILPENNKFFGNKESLLNIIDSNNEGKLKNNLNEWKEIYNFFAKINSKINFIADVLKEIKGTFRITDGLYNGDNISFKYYESSWKGGSKAKIKTHDFPKIGKNISKVTGKISRVNDLKDFYIAIKEDGYKFGDKTIVTAGEKLGKWGGTKYGIKYGVKIGVKIGSLIPFHPLATRLIGGIIGGIVGGFIGSFTGRKGGEFVVDIKNDKTEDIKEE